MPKNNLKNSIARRFHPLKVLIISQTGPFREISSALPQKRSKPFALKPIRKSLFSVPLEN
jgi:hypothetical protein